jgi:peptide/nickel transport system substrate-binding protein
MRKPSLALTAAVGAFTLLPLAVACGSAGGSSATTPAAAQSQNSNVLTVASAIAPNSLNPALGGSSDPQQYFFELDYDTLIGQNANGGYVPDLATKWGYVGSGNKTFDITLRAGVTFNDGSKLTAQDVKNSLEYYAKAGGPLAADLAPIGSIDVLSTLALRINLKTADPMMPFYLSRPTTGDIISPIGLANTGSLGTTTHGAGPYVIDAAATVSGQTYTYVPNPTYWDKSGVHWTKVVIKVITDPNATLDALRSGEVDYALGDASTAKAAKSAGFQVDTTPYSVMQLQIMDRTGTMDKALGSLQVRQAMMYAIDRSQVASGLFGSYAKPWDASILQGETGYSLALATGYSYDVAKAKQLLAAAGYPNGFKLPIIVNLTGVDEPEAAQAFAAEMANIGIDVQIDVPANVTTLFATYTKYPAMMFDYGSGASPPYAQGNDMLYSWGNPFKVNDPQLNSLYTQASSATSPAVQDKAWQAFETQFAALDWNIPMFSLDKIIYARPGLGGINLSQQNLNPDLADLYLSK